MTTPRASRVHIILGGGPRTRLTLCVVRVKATRSSFWHTGSTDDDTGVRLVRRVP